MERRQPDDDAATRRAGRDRRAVVVELRALMDELQALVETSPRLPFSGRTIISAGAVLDLIAALRDAIPPGLPEAERVRASADGYVQECFGRLEAQALELAERLRRAAGRPDDGQGGS